jgi:hypothetical protein
MTAGAPDAQAGGVVPQIRRCTDCTGWPTGSKECCDYELVCPDPEDPENCGYDYINCQTERCGYWSRGAFDWLIFG